MIFENQANEGISRRQFIQTIASASVIAACAKDTTAKRENPQDTIKPNIILIISDEHNRNVLGSYGNEIIKTPNLNSLAGKGVIFDNCYCNSPLCVPSRLSFLSGKYISQSGAWSNSCWLPSDDYPTLPGIMEKAGYDSFLCGRMHLDETRRYGYKEIGNFNSNKYIKTGKGGRRNPDDLNPYPGLSGRFNGFTTGEISPILSHDSEVTRKAIDFFKAREYGSKPFFLTIGYFAPHYPLIVPEAYWHHYKGKIPDPEIPENHLESQPLNYKHLRIAFNVEDAPVEVVRKGRELYYGLVQWLDEQIGNVLDALKQTRFTNNTIVIYTSDHGEMMGEHGLWWKNAMYDDATRVPLIINYPARWERPQRKHKICSLLDLNRTIADIASVKVPDNWKGDSMLEWLDEHNAPWKDIAVSEYYAHYVASGYAMIRTSRYKYVYHTPPDKEHPPEHELYDIAQDPHEYNNLATDPKHRNNIKNMFEQLVEEIGEHPDMTEKRCREDYSHPYERPE